MTIKSRNVRKVKKVRNMISTWAKDNEVDIYYGGSGFNLSENSPYYRKIRHAFMLDRAEGENGYLAAYWSAFDTIAARWVMKGYSRDFANNDKHTAANTSSRGVAFGK